MEAPGLSNDSVTNRVAGMSLKYTLQEHKDAVIGVACFKKDETHWLVSILGKLPWHVKRTRRLIDGSIPFPPDYNWI